MQQGWADTISNHHTPEKPQKNGVTSKYSNLSLLPDSNLQRYVVLINFS
ncbi:MAG: hypothetical protein RL748_1183 [Pseudomonadota bacterium]